MNCSMKLYIFVITLLLLNTQINGSWFSFFDYIWPNRNARLSTDELQSVPKVPFEIGERDEKFILEASRILGTRLSEQGFCEQRVILTLKNSCSSLDDEQVGKLSIALMNCQLLAEGHSTTHECTETMSLADCMSGWDLEVRQSYYNYQSRAKTICLLVRQDQFRGMAEITVNRLVDSAHATIDEMSDLKRSQNQLKQSTLESIDEISTGNMKLLEQQQEIAKISDRHRITGNHNYRASLRERILLRGKHNEMIAFIVDLKMKIQDGIDNFRDQSAETREVYKALLNDISDLHSATENIVNRLNEASHLVSQQSQRTQDDFKETVTQLKEVNEIVLNLSEIVRDFREDYNEKLKWLSKQLGGNDENLIKYLTAISIHIIYLLIGMLCLIFINAQTINRIIFLAVVSLSLVAVLYDIVPLNMATLSETILLIFASKYIYGLSQKYDLKDYFKFSNLVENKDEVLLHRNNNGNVTGEIIGDGSETARRRTQQFVTHLTTEDDRQSERSRSSLDAIGNRCSAITARGSRCQLPALGSFTEFCRIHDRDSYER